MIDKAEVERMLRQALWDIADTLARRQEVSQAAAELMAEERRQTLTRDASLTARLRTARQDADLRLRALDARLTTYTSYLRTAATEGEQYVDELRLLDKLSRIEYALETVADTPPTNAGEELADHTVAVLDAYRNLLRITQPPASG
jgi:hypothetical protein